MIVSRTCVALVAALLMTAASAQATTISFNGFADFEPVDQGYGDVPGKVNVGYSLASGSVPFFWFAGYDGGDGLDLGALLGSTSDDADTLTITLTGLNGHKFTLYEFAVGRQVSALQTQGTFKILADGIEVYNWDDVAGILPLISAGGFVSSATTLQFVLGGNWNIGYQSIGYETESAVIPVPASGLLLLTGMTWLVSTRASRRRADA